MIVSNPEIEAALAVIADAGPIQKAVQAVMTETAERRLTPRFRRIGKIDAINSRLSPAADGIQMNKILPIGITHTAAIFGWFLKTLKGLIAK